VPITIGIGLLGVSLAFGLTVVTMAYAVGHVSGCHLNPAVSFGLFTAGRFSFAELIPYILSQTAGAIAGAAVLYFIRYGSAEYPLALDTSHPGVFACNGYGTEGSPHGYNIVSCALGEFVLTFFFLFIILGTTDPRNGAGGFAGLAIGLALALIHMVGIPLTNLSVNPARSTGPALLVALVKGDFAIYPIAQLWLFWLAPIAGGIVAGIVYPIMAGYPKKT
jgi:aquaporin Z